MRRVRYSVAVSLDGFIAGPQGEYDWITEEPGVDFVAFMRKIDTLVMGRGTYEVAMRDGPEMLPKMRTIVVSRTMRPEDHPGVEIVADPVPAVAALREEEGKDVWLFGGGQLFHTLLGAGLVDMVEVAIMPILLSDGIPLLPPIDRRTPLKLMRHEVFPSGVILVRYEVVRG